MCCLESREAELVWPVVQVSRDCPWLFQSAKGSASSFRDGAPEKGSHPNTTKALALGLACRSGDCQLPAQPLRHALRQEALIRARNVTWAPQHRGASRDAHSVSTRVRACVRVCASVCARVCAYVRARVCACACVHVRACVRVYVRACARARARVLGPPVPGPPVPDLRGWHSSVTESPQVTGFCEGYTKMT